MEKNPPTFQSILRAEEMKAERKSSKIAIGGKFDSIIKFSKVN